MNTINTIKDPVCGMTIQPEKAAGTLEHLGTTYHFCSTHCLEKFHAEPQKYVPQPKAAEPSPASSQSDAWPYSSMKRSC